MIEEIIKEKLPQFSKQKTEKELGNREKYIGASDVGGCPRKVVLSKFTQEEPNVETLIRFQRGHIAEEIIKNVLSQTKFLWETQYEVSHPELSYVKAHLDFVIHNKDNSKIFILENKSTSYIPKEAYGSWNNQLQFQMGLVKLNYPNAIIKGSILAIDVNSGSYKEYEIQEPNEDVFNYLIEKAQKIWQLLQRIETDIDNNELETEIGPLCGFCLFKGSCPEFTSDDPKLSVDFKGLINRYIDLSGKEKASKEEKESIKNEIINLVGNKFYTKFDGVKVSISIQSQQRVDTNLLKTNFQEIYQSCLKNTESLVFRIS